MRLPAQLLQRAPNAHKGDFGHVFIIAGSAGLSGAGVLAAGAALRSGAGLVTLGLPQGINNAIIKIKPPEVMTLPMPETDDGAVSVKAERLIAGFIKKADVVVVGPGLSKNKSTQILIRRLIGVIVKPLIIDADALNALAGHLVLLRGKSLKMPAVRILTPHPCEMSRLLGCSVNDVQSHRKEIAKRFTKDYNITIVLKGENTVVAGPRDDLYINRTGNPGMATAGSGDVLSGIIAAFLGQGLCPFDAAKYAVYIHGLAGDLAARDKTQIGMIASDIIDKIPWAIKRCS